MTGENIRQPVYFVFANFLQKNASSYAKEVPEMRMSVRTGALAASSPIFFLMISAIVFSASSNAANRAALAVPRPVARSDQQSSATQAAPTPQSENTPASKAGTPSRWEGIVVASNPQKSTLDVRKRSNNVIRTIHYDSSTKWVSQYHGSKKINDIDASQVKEGDRVICVGTYQEKGEFRAVYISKRLRN
jgi:hypothetical protein